MSDKQKSAPDHGRNRPPEKQQDPASFYIEQLRALAAKNPELLRQLDLILEKLKGVFNGVQFIVGGMLKQEVDAMSVKNASMKATVTALVKMNLPAQIDSSRGSSNDERFDIAA